MAAEYKNAVDTATIFQNHVTDQVKGFFKFCRAGDLDGFIRRRDWRDFTRRYNGPGQVEHYSGVLKQYLAPADPINFK